MSRSGYSEDCENLELYRASVASAINGKRGQAFFRELKESLDALPNKRLIDGVLVSADGECCAMGAIAIKRGEDTSGVDPYERDQIGKMFNIAPSLAAEVAFVNDDEWSGGDATPELRYERVYKWVVAQIRPVDTHTKDQSK